VDREGSQLLFRVADSYESRGLVITTLGSSLSLDLDSP
jgi:hypothetical protein